MAGTGLMKAKQDLQVLPCRAAINMVNGKTRGRKPWTGNGKLLTARCAVTERECGIVMGLEAIGWTRLLGTDGMNGLTQQQDGLGRVK